MQMTATRASAQPTSAIERRSSAIARRSSATYAPASVKSSLAGRMAVGKETSAATPHAIGWRQFNRQAAAHDRQAAAHERQAAREAPAQRPPAADADGEEHHAGGPPDGDG